MINKELNKSFEKYQQLIYDYTRQKTLKDVLKIINEDLDDYHRRLKNKQLPELVQANLSGMVLSLEVLWQKLKREIEAENGSQ
jgi:hypothetical protein